MVDVYLLKHGKKNREYNYDATGITDCPCDFNGIVNYNYFAHC